MRAAATTPAEPAGARVARFPTDDSLPQTTFGSASASGFSRHTQRSLTLRPAWLLNRPRRSVTSKCFRPCRYLITRSDCYRLERQLPGGVRTRCEAVPFTAHDRPWRSSRRARSRMLPGPARPQRRSTPPCQITTPRLRPGSTLPFPLTVAAGSAGGCSRDSAPTSSVRTPVGGADSSPDSDAFSISRSSFGSAWPSLPSGAGASAPAVAATASRGTNVRRKPDG